jgi:hypothetical protein
MSVTVATVLRPGNCPTPWQQSYTLATLAIGTTSYVLHHGRPLCDYTLYPTLYTLHLAAYTLHLTLYTVKYTSDIYTPHPILYTLGSHSKSLLRQP